MFGTWTIYSPVQTEIVQQAKFDRTGSTYNSLWKRVGDKKTIEPVNLLMNDVSYRSCVENYSEYVKKLVLFFTPSKMVVENFKVSYGT